MRAPSHVGRAASPLLAGAAALLLALAYPGPLGAAEAPPDAGPAQEPGGPAGPPAGAVVPDPDQFEAAAPTDDAELEAQVRKLARQLRCPTCQALSIADSPSELAREMEGVIRLRLQEGMTPEEVRASFVDAYGEWVLLSPNPSGFNLLVYLLPPLVLLLGFGIVVMGVRKWIAGASGGSAPPPSGPDSRDGPPVPGETAVGAPGGNGKGGTEAASMHRSS